MQPVSRRRQIETVRQFHAWPETAQPVYTPQPSRPAEPAVLGTASGPIDDGTLADCCILLGILAKTDPKRVAQFFGLTGTRDEKIAFLLRYGHFEKWRNPA